MSIRVLVVDNHDSFVHTLAGYLRELGALVTIVESDAGDEAFFDALLNAHDAVLLSPGPGRPVDAGATLAVVPLAAERGIPLLGVCLGHQSLAEALGGRVVQAPDLMHGMVSPVTHDGSALFAGIPSPFNAGRYHSLAVTDLPEELIVTAWTESGTIMGMQHRTAPLWGVQFHPESVLTEAGYRLLANWLELSGDTSAVAASRTLDPLRR